MCFFQSSWSKPSSVLLLFLFPLGLQFIYLFINCCLMPTTKFSQTWSIILNYSTLFFLKNFFGSILSLVIKIKFKKQTKASRRTICDCICKKWLLGNYLTQNFKKNILRICLPKHFVLFGSLQWNKLKTFLRFFK